MPSKAMVAGIELRVIDQQIKALGDRRHAIEDRLRQTPVRPRSEWADWLRGVADQIEENDLDTTRRSLEEIADEIRMEMGRQGIPF